MADKTDNIKTKLAFDGEAEYKAACKELNSNLRLLGSEMKLVTAEYKNNATSTEALKAKQDVLKRTYDEQAKKVEETEKALKAMKEAQGENSDGAKRLETALNQQKTALVNTKNALDDTDKALEEAEKGADNFGKEVEDSGKQADEATGKFNGLGSAVEKMAKGLAVGVATIAATAVTTIAGLTNAAIDGYADYEQLVGGVETLFKDSAKKVEAYANDAYKTAGMSANEYMETVTGFSAALLQSLEGDTKTATEKANQAIIDMSDNANKMGSDISSIQTAYQGFAKQNYTMLDNLKLGYGGTKQEMQRLLDDATKLSGVKYDISSYADIVDAIHVVQTEMDITGTTAKEASTTISGSISSMKSSWSNWVTGMANENADFSQLTQNMVDSILTVIQNIAPRVVETVPRLVDGLSELGKQLAAYIPTIMEQLVPPLLEGISSLSQTIVDILPELLEIISGLLPQIINVLVELIPQLADTAVEIILGLAQGLADALPQLVPQLVDLMLYIVDTLVQNIPTIIEAASEIILGLAQGLADALPMLAERLPEIIVAIINGLVEALPQVIECAGEIILALGTGLVEALPILIENLPQIVIAIVEGLGQVIPQVALLMLELNQKAWEILKELPGKIWDAIITAVAKMVEWGIQMQDKAHTAMANLTTKVINALKELPGKIWNAIITCVTKIAEWGTKMQDKAKSAIASVCTSIVNGFKNLPDKLVNIGTNIVQGLWNGINNAKDWILDKIKGFGDAVLEGLKSFFGIASPSKVMRDQVGVFLAQGIGVGFTEEMEKVSRDINNSIPREFDVRSKVNIDAGTDDDYEPKRPRGFGGAAGDVTVIQNIYAKDTSYKAQQKEAAKQFKDIAREVVA